MKTYNAYFSVWENADHHVFLNFIKNLGLGIQTKVSTSLSPDEAVLADVIFVDEKTASQQCAALSDIKKENRDFLPVLLFTTKKANTEKTLPPCIDDVILSPFSQAEWKRRLQTYLDLRRKEMKFFRQEESEYKALFTESHSIMLLVDPETGKIEDANHAACRFYGYTYSEMTSMKVQQINMLKEEQVSHEMANGGSNKKNYFVFEHRLADGSARTVEVHSRKVNHKGKPLLYSIIRDITETKKTEELLRESEENYRKFIENAPDIVVLIDKKGIVRFINQRIREYGNYDPEEITGKPFTNFIPPEDHQKAMDAVMKIFDNIQAAPFFSSSLLLKDGRKIPIITRSILIKHCGKMVNMTIVRDISFIKETEEKLKRSEETFENIFNNSSVAIYVQDKEGTFLDINKAALRQYALSDKNELIGKKPEFVAAEGRNNMAEIKKYLSLAFNGAPQQFEFWAKRKDGTVFPKLVIIERGIYFGQSVIFNFSLDISERKKMEEALRESEAKYRSIFKTSSDAISITEFISGKYIETNDIFKKTLGYTKEELVGKTSLELKIWVNAEERKKMISTLKKKAFIKDVESQFRDKRGRVITGLLSAQLISLRGNEYIVGETRDISRIKQAEDALRESRQLFATLANISPTGIFRTDARGKTTYVNPKWSEITGVSFEKATNKGWVDVLHPDEKEELLSRWANNIATQTFSNEKLRIVRPDGTVRWILGHAVPEVINNKFTGYVGTITDITDLVKAELSLRESENKYRSLAETSSDLILTFDTDGKLTYLSPVVQRITGYSVEEVLHKNFWEFIMPEYVESTIEKFKRGITEEYVPLYEIELIHKNGKSVPVELNVTSLHDADGNTIGRLAVTRDITDRKKAEKALKESEARLKRFSQITKEGIIIHKNRIIVDANQAILHMLGYSAEELVGQDIIKKLALPKYHQIIKKNIKKEYVKSYDIETFKKDGTTLPIEVAGINYTDINGETLRAVVFRDITQRREMEKALRESENKYRSLAEVSIDMILTYDLRGKITYVNPIVKTIFGYYPEELVGKRFHKYIAPEFLEKALSSFSKGKQGNPIPLYEIELIHKNGQRIPVEINPTPIYDTEGKIMGGLSIIRDVRVRKKAGKALKESEEKYKEQSRLFRLMSDNIPDLVWAKDPDGRFIFTNKAICVKLLIAKDTDEPIGKRDPYFAERQRRLYPNRKKWYTFDELCSESDALVYNTQKPVRSNEFGYVKGKFLYFDVYKAPIFDENNQIIGTVGHGRDVTKEKEAEKALLLRDKALNATASAIIITDAGGKIEWVNMAFTKLSGYSEKEVLGKSTIDLVGTGSQDEAFYENLHNTLKSGQVWTGEFKDKRKDGTLYEVGEVITPVTDKNGKVEHLIGIMNDISERKTAERELWAAKEAAEESSRLKSAFLANMNHEIRTPMNAIMGFSDLMLDATPEEKINYAQIVYKSAGQLLNLIDNIIFLSRLQSEKLPVKKTNFYPDDLIKEIFLMFDLPEMKKNLQLQSQFPENAGTITMYADAYKIRQVMTNFTSNAIKYTKKGYVKLGFEMHDNNILFFVEDSGMGIPENEQQHILETFYRGSRAVSEAIRGTGLGLNIAKELVELMGSTIGVTSQPGKGSRFYFSLPYEPSKTTFTEETPQKTEPKNWEDVNILIAEDDETNFLYLDVLLREKVNRIDRAHNGLEAIEMTRQNTYDLVLMDLKMPVMSGAEATLEIKKRHPHLPVIATTAYATPEEKARAMDAGCDDYLGKPIKKADITALINKYIP